MRPIGRIGDGATDTSARVILLKDLEKEIRAEEFVLIKNGGEDNPVNEIVGVLREGLGKNEFLSHSSYRPDVAYLRYGGEPSGSREVFSFLVLPIGSKGEKGLEPNRFIIAPRSPVYLLEDDDKPLELLSKGVDRIAWLDAFIVGHEDWKVPVRKEFIPYHVGVYGSTGSGKSWFARYVLLPLYRRVGYDVIVLDWSGTDYAPYAPDKVIPISDVAMDEESVLSYLKDKTWGFGGNLNVQDAFESFVEGWTEKVLKSGEDSEKLYKMLRECVEKEVENIRREDWKASARRALRRVFRRLGSEDLKPLMGTLSIGDLIARLRRQGTLIIDMSGASTETKLGFFLSLGRRLQELMEEGEEVNIALVIDEAPQYAPWEARGIQSETSNLIKDLAALGRKRKLNLTLISQGIKGEIGINAAVRRNLNTHFFGRIHPLDAGGEGGAAEWLSPYGINPEHMLQLEPGKFYFSGAMNPSPIPLLITFKPESEGRSG